MAAQTAESNPYGGSSFNWSTYNYRPTYPQSLIDLMLSYHRAHSSSWDLAHDVGSGNGVFAAELSRHFKHVHVSEPSAENLVIAKENLGKLQAPASFTFSQGGAEHADTQVPADLAKRDVDIVTAMESIHWCTAIDQASRAIGSTLGPGGTFAAVFYGPQPHVPDNDAANKILDRMFAELTEGTVKLRSSAATKGMAQCITGLDFLPLPDDVYQRSETRRLYINSTSKHRFTMLQYGDWVEPVTSQVAEGEQIEEYVEGDSLAEGWSQEVSAEWWKPFIKSVSGHQHIKDLRGSLDELQNILGGPAAATKIWWPVGVVLATKKS